MKMLKIISLSIFLVLSGASSAHAMGDREQAALLCAGAAVLLGGIINAAQQPVRYVESPTYYAPAPTVVYREPYYVPPRVIYVDPPRYYHRPHHHHHYDGYRYYR